MSASDATLKDPPVDASQLDALFRTLRTERLAVGPREEIAVKRLLAEIFAGATIESAHELKPVLTPVLARSSEERERFSRAFDRHFPPPAPPPPPVVDPATAKPSSSTRPALIALVVLFAIAAVVYTFWTQATPDTTTVQQEADERQGPIVTTPPQTTGNAPAPASAPAIPEQLVREAVDEILIAASHWSYAPTLDELSQALAPRYGWPPNELSIRLRELTGLPRRELLPLLFDWEILDRLVRALWLVSDPKLMPAANVVSAQVDVAMRQEFARSNQRFAPMPLTYEFARSWEGTEQPESYTRATREFPSCFENIAGRPREGRPVASEPAGSRCSRSELLFGSPPRFLPGWPMNAEQAKRQAAKFLRSGATYDSVNRALSLWNRRHEDNVPLSDVPWKPKAATSLLTHASPLTPFLSAALALGLTCFWLGQAIERRKAYLRRRAPKAAIAITELVAEQIRDTHAKKLVFAKAGRRLQRWSEREGGRIDIARTIEATLTHGRFTPVGTRTKSQPEYLFLIEAASAGDQQAARLRTLVRRLEDRVRHIAVYYYSGTPAWCHPENAKRGAEAPFVETAQPIEELVARFAGHRLVVLGIGESFIDRAGRNAAPSVEALSRWPQRAMLTPLALDEWGAREFMLAREVGLPLGRATEEGLLSLAALLGLEGGEAELFSAEGDGMARPVPQIFRLRPIEWTLNEPPSGTEWPALRATLKRYLDPTAYLWLCACAIYPALRWDLILYLGVKLKDPSGQSLYREDRLGGLTSLPWFREGRMPDWLRARLIEDIGDEAEAIRAALRALIKKSDAHLADEREPIRFRIASERAGLAEAHEDEIFLDFLAKGQVTDFEVGWLDALKSLLPRAARPWLDTTAVATAAIGATLALIAFSVAPRGAQVGVFDANNLAAEVLPDGAWAPLIVALAALPLALIAADHQPLRRLVELAGPRLSMFARASAVLCLLFVYVYWAITQDMRWLFSIVAPPLSILLARNIVQKLGEPVAISYRAVDWALGLAAKSAGLMAFWAALALLVFGSASRLDEASLAVVTTALACLIVAAFASGVNRVVNAR